MKAVRLLFNFFSVESVEVPDFDTDPLVTTIVDIRETGVTGVFSFFSVQKGCLVNWPDIIHS